MFMRNERIKAVTQVSECLFEAEQAIDLAVSAAAKLSSVMPTARSDAHLSALLGQDALTSAILSLSCLAKARDHMVQTHVQLDQVKTQIGLREMAFGGGMQKQPSADLRVVSRAAA
jgi:hypothetical protein